MSKARGRPAATDLFGFTAAATLREAGWVPSPDKPGRWVYPLDGGTVEVVTEEALATQARWDRERTEGK